MTGASGTSKSFNLCDRAEPDVAALPSLYDVTDALLLIHSSEELSVAMI
jgi:hypothetical protein